jgi:hypothetical protein
MKALTVSLLMLLLSPFAIAQEPITGKLVNIAVGNQGSDITTLSSNSPVASAAESGYPNTLFFNIAATDGIRYICAEYARYTSHLHSGRWVVGGTVSLKIKGDKAEISSSEGFTANTTILKRERIQP